MKSKLLPVLIFIFAIGNGYAQNPIFVSESTIMLDLEQSKELFFSFAEGDEIVFDMEMIKGKHIKEIEVVELPTNTVLTEFKSTGITNKRIQIRNKGLYKFRFYSSSLTRRVCKIKIHRIPKSPETESFNTNWRWETVKDTTYTAYQEDSLVGYQTKSIKKKVKELIKTDTTFVQLLTKNERVHSETAIGKTPYSYINVHLPKNSYSPNRANAYQSTETFAWSHWIGVGQKSQEEYDQANDKVINGIKIIGSLTPYGALANFAATGISMFNDTSIGDNVIYRFITIQNGVQNVFNSGNGITDIGRNTELLQGGFTIELHNDNFREGINVKLEVVVAQINKTWKDREYIENIEEPQYVTLNKTRMNVNETKIRVPVE